MHGSIKMQKKGKKNRVGKCPRMQVFRFGGPIPKRIIFLQATATISNCDRPATHKNIPRLAGNPSIINQ